MFEQGITEQNSSPWAPHSEEGVAPGGALVDWSAIRAPDRLFVVELRPSPLSAETMIALLAMVPATLSFAGPLDELENALADMPRDLVSDVSALACRFATLMHVETVRVRIEALDNDACTRLHADYTDVRLITTYSGPGTDYTEGDDPTAPMLRMSTGSIGLFKGRLFGRDHAPCLHRSPPIAAAGQRRLVLVIDTPLRT